MDKRYGRVSWGVGHPRSRTSEANWNLPVRWAVEAARRGVRPRVFCASLADWLDGEVPAEWLADLLQVIALTPELDWLLLTKRIEYWRIRLEVAHQHAKFNGNLHLVEDWLDGRKVPENVWLGVSVENQQYADERIPLLLKTPAAVRFISAEPLLSDVNLSAYLRPVATPGQCRDIDGNWWHTPGSCAGCKPGLDLVIVGGESGPGARPFDIAWARNIIEQCRVAGVACFMKQLGSNAQSADMKWTERVYKITGKGGLIEEWPENLRVRQMPEVTR